MSKEYAGTTRQVQVKPHLTAAESKSKCRLSEHHDSLPCFRRRSNLASKTVLQSSSSKSRRSYTVQEPPREEATEKLCQGRNKNNVSPQFTTTHTHKTRILHAYGCSTPHSLGPWRVLPCIATHTHTRKPGVLRSSIIFVNVPTFARAVLNGSLVSISHQVNLLLQARFLFPHRQDCVVLANNLSQYPYLLIILRPDFAPRRDRLHAHQSC